MSEARVDAIKEGLASAGIEVYRVRGDTIEVAERVRYHLMDAGIRVLARDPIEVHFTARSQRSENPGLDGKELFALVRSAISEAAEGKGFQEASASKERVTDPVDPTRVLDVWYEVTYTKSVSDVREAAESVRWVLSLERFVRGSVPQEGKG